MRKRVDREAIINAAPAACLLQAGKEITCEIEGTTMVQDKYIVSQTPKIIRDRQASRLRASSSPSCEVPHNARSSTWAARRQRAIGSYIPLFEMLVHGEQFGVLVGLDSVPGSRVVFRPNNCTSKPTREGEPGTPRYH